MDSPNNCKESGRPTFAVIIPALNEEQGLPSTLVTVLKQHLTSKLEVVVVDGGSQDKTVEVADSAGARVVSAGRGRALQMNTGAASVPEARYLLFLHADTSLPPSALRSVEEAFEDPKVHGGCFQLRFDQERHSPSLWLWGWLTRLWLFRSTRLVFGDRAIFVRRSTFDALGGYESWPILEDVDFAQRLHLYGGRGCFRFLNVDVVTSSRRLLEIGPIKQQLLNTSIMALWYLGFSPQRLKELYKYRVPKLPQSTTAAPAEQPAAARKPRSHESSDTSSSQLPSSHFATEEKKPDGPPHL
mmetsp:Transcript_2193/g.4660  ORF Transcript_2193/g.4660 Transcript_2193/m.4660 type:complete len:300 (-) Transcript_2193:7-906(-)